MIAALVKLLVDAITGSADQQKLVVAELRRLNNNIERIWPVEQRSILPPEEPVLGDDPYTLAMAADAEMTLSLELGRAPTTEEVLERMEIWQQRKDPLPARGHMIDAGERGQ